MLLLGISDYGWLRDWEFWGVVVGSVTLSIVVSQTDWAKKRGQNWQNNRIFEVTGLPKRLSLGGQHVDVRLRFKKAFFCQDAGIEFVSWEHRTSQVGQDLVALRLDGNAIRKQYGNKRPKQSIEIAADIEGKVAKKFAVSAFVVDEAGHYYRRYYPIEFTEQPSPHKNGLVSSV